MNAPQRNWTAVRSAVFDTFQNLVSGLGSSKDKSVHTRYVMNLLGKDQLDIAYRADWVARKVVDAPPFDMTREWRGWRAEDKQIEKLIAEEDRLGLRWKVKRALVRGRLYGGGLLVMGVGNDNQRSLWRLTGWSLARCGGFTLPRGMT